MELNTNSEVYNHSELAFDNFLKINSIQKKKGIKGILYLTNAPKLVPAMPTPNANKIEKTKQ